MNLRIYRGLLFLLILLMPGSSFSKPGSFISSQWDEIELTFLSRSSYGNPYTDVEFFAEFTGTDGTKILRPGFWDGENRWKIRFASPEPEGEWKYLTYCSNNRDKGLHDKRGLVKSVPYQGENLLIRHGLLRMSPGKRNIVHADGTPFLLVGDTPWALPFRATTDNARVYAQDRQRKGFNAALLMSVQPDRNAKGPESRTERNGFDVAFHDLKDGHINRINISYFQYLDKLMAILIDHGIVPVYNPVFHGFGWKGLNVLGKSGISPEEYARYCRYLVARYGSKPAMWLVGADSDGKDSGVREGGMEIGKWDAYQQPTGLHYNPFDTGPMPSGSTDHTMHENKSHQDAEWLDFQWCQTGQGGATITTKVEEMYNNLPVKAVANGEPTYESNRGDSALASGWWQGNEAWLQFTSGGTMGVVYGAGGVWNWQLFRDEEGWPVRRKGITPSPKTWKEALDYSGSVYVGNLGKALAGLPIADIQKRPDLAGGKLCLAIPEKLFIVYLPAGGEVTLSGLTPGMKYKWFDPVAGEFVSEGNTGSQIQTFNSGSHSPIVLRVSSTR